jgi:hypothetical protein
MLLQYDDVVDVGSHYEAADSFRSGEPSEQDTDGLGHVDCVQLDAEQRNSARPVAGAQIEAIRWGWQHR